MNRNAFLTLAKRMHAHFDDFTGIKYVKLISVLNRQACYLLPNARLFHNKSFSANQLIVRREN